MKYINNNKEYEVESVSANDACIQVNGTTITDQGMMARNLDMPFDADGYTVFVDGDEVCFDTFEEANNYLISKELCEKILDVLEENCEEDSYDEVEVSHTQLAKNYGASIDVKLDDEKFYGEIEVAYKRGKGYYIKYIDYDA